MHYPLLHCKKCTARLNNSNASEITRDSRLFVVEEKGRHVYFAPVGNQFNFGRFANGKTPKVIVMGITTSPSARDNFILDFNNLRGEGLGDSEALATSCMKNIFNSDNTSLLRVLSKILNGSGVVKLTGCAGIIEINRDFFRKCHDDVNYEKIAGNIYFTQMIMCASCEDKNGSRAPKRLEEIGDYQKKCIESQLDFIRSFDSQVDLLITFGKINQMIIEGYDTENIIEAKCKHHVNINHPTTRGWNMMDSLYLGRGKYMEKVEERVNGNNVPYRSSLINCYDQFIEIKNIVSRLLAE